MGYVHFVLPIQNVLTLVLDWAVLYGNVALSIVVLSTRKRYFSFSKKKKVLVFQKFVSTLKYRKRLKSPVIPT